jgi:hypothetical protein
MKSGVLASLMVAVLAGSLTACGGGASLGSLKGNETPATTKMAATKTARPATRTPKPAPVTATPEPQTATAEPLTAVHQYVTDATGIAQQGSGSCWTSSIASGRKDAYRCNCEVAGSEANIFDPCFESQDGALSVVCPGDPRDVSTGVVCSLTEALPPPEASQGDSVWFMVVDARGCFVFTGTIGDAGELGGEMFEMGCSGKSGSTGTSDYFACHPPEELQPGQWFAECAGRMSAKARYFVTDIWK